MFLFISQVFGNKRKTHHHWLILVFWLEYSWILFLFHLVCVALISNHLYLKSTSIFHFNIQILWINSSLFFSILIIVKRFQFYVKSIKSLSQNLFLFANFISNICTRKKLLKVLFCSWQKSWMFKLEWKDSHQ